MGLFEATVNFRRDMDAVIEQENRDIRNKQAEIDIDNVDDLQQIRDLKTSVEASKSMLELLCAYADELRDLEKKMDKILAILSK